MNALTTDNSVSTPEPEYSGPHKWQVKPWAKLVRRALRQREYSRWVEQYCTPLTVHGRERLNHLYGPAIFIANHQSHMDTPVIMESLPEHLKDNFYFGAAADRWFVKGKKKLILQPWYQSLALGNFPIVRGGGSKTLEYGRWLLSQGCNICIFPEGTRATTDELGEFRHGVSLLARAARVPVVPVVMKGLRELRPKGAKEVVPGPVSATILDPVYLTNDLTVEASTKLLRDIMNKEFGQTIQLPERQKDSTTTEEDAHYNKAA
ncbi:MAG: 1-acyl-sn-glycerol-3-phosphate acyltransferase [Pseudomonadales bacterium]|nr:1-acyl-sn-glycerol-3-phosphate acyltransferase [Pseudomonadales bacterium]